MGQTRPAAFFYPIYFSERRVLMQPRIVIHADLDAFFASVELKRRPELKGMPVVVGADGDPSKRGVVSAASYEARKFGIKAGMPLKTAFKKCSKAVFLPVDFEAYEKESERFMAILRDYSPLVESFGLDEGFVEINIEGLSDSDSVADRIGREIKTRVKKELGLTVSIGIGPNKLISKTACDMGKPDGFFVIKGSEAEKVLRELPVRKLWGVGPRTEKRLKDLGVNTIGELAKLPHQFLERNFGPVLGKTLYEHAKGIDDSPVVPFYEPDSFGREVTFEEDTLDIHIIRETLYALTEDVTARLKDTGYKGGTVTIKVRYSDFKTITRSAALEEKSDSMNDIWKAALSLLEAVDFPKAARLVGVKVSKLTGWKG